MKNRTILTIKLIQNECQVGKNKAISIKKEIKTAFKTNTPTLYHLDKYLFN